MSGMIPFPDIQKVMLQNIKWAILVWDRRKNTKRRKKKGTNRQQNILLQLENLLFI